MKVAVLVSGGVDSSVALRLLQEQGHDVTAFYLKIWLEDELSFLGTCPWQEDLRYVEAVCKQADIPLRVIPLQKQYWDIVVSYVIDQVKEGRTPNPDILCNQHIKFGAFIDCIDDSFDVIASGHYAQKHTIEGGPALFVAPDAIKDQTYFLSYLRPEQLARVIFPIGHLTKKEVRSLARYYNLPNRDRKDSQGICFLGKLKYDEFIKYHLGTREGDLVEIETGAKLGKHRGFWFYTVGQRSGLGLSGGPWYVVSKDTATNKVFISRDYYAPDKQRDLFTMININWVSGKQPASGDYVVKLRHGAQMHHGTVNFLDANRAMVRLATRDQGIAPGQFAVLYEGDRCLGAGIISD